MAKCTFWYQLTQVVLDKVLRAVVCVDNRSVNFDDAVHVCVCMCVWLGSFKSLAQCTFLLFLSLCVLFTLLYSFHASVDIFFKFQYFFFFSLTASTTSSFNHHVSLCLQGSFDNPHVTCAVSIIIFFICCQCSFTSKYFHSASVPYL